MFIHNFTAFLFVLASAATAADDYQLGPLSQIKEGVPQGKVIPMPVHESNIYAGTKRDWWIYVPAQYQAEKPTNLMVFQDGHDYVGLKGAWRVPVVFDNLIASGEMAPTLAIFINPGHSGESPPVPGKTTIVARNTILWVTLTPAFSSKKSSLRCRKITASPLILKAGQLVALAAVPFVPLPLPGSGQIASARSSPRSAVM
jgi:hypothetical protein